MPSLPETMLADIDTVILEDSLKTVVIENGIEQLVPTLQSGSIVICIGRRAGEHRYEVLRGLLSPGGVDTRDLRNLAVKEIPEYTEIAAVQLLRVVRNHNLKPPLSPPNERRPREKRCSVCGSLDHNKRYHNTYSGK